jgi:hypothetical protein
MESPAKANGEFRRQEYRNPSFPKERYGAGTSLFSKAISGLK